jgi:hypothetical protein
MHNGICIMVNFISFIKHSYFSSNVFSCLLNKTSSRLGIWVGLVLELGLGLWLGLGLRFWLGLGYG